MSTDQQAHDALRALVREPVELSDDGLDTVLAGVPATPQQRPSRRHFHTGRFQPMFSATRSLVAAAVVALFGGFLLVGVLTLQSEEDAPIAGSSTTPDAAISKPIELPAEVPAGVQWGVLETPLGPARWVHLVGDDATLPKELLGMLSTPEGFIVPEGSGTGARLWRSSDLISWTPEPLGFEAEWPDLSRSGDTYWLSAFDPASMWRSTDTESWEQVSLAGLAPPGPDGFAWVARPGQPVAFGEVTIVPVEWYPDYQVVTRDLPVLDGTEPWPALAEVAPGVYDIRSIVSFPRGALSEHALATVRLEETPEGLRVLDHEDGAELKVLEGVSMAFIELLASEKAHRGAEIVPSVPALGILEDGAFVDVEPPLRPQGSGQQAFAADTDGLVAYTLGADGLVHVHRSQDGRVWTESDVIGDDPGEPAGVEEIYAWRGRVSLYTSPNEPAWSAATGLELQPAAPGGDSYRVGNGWVRGPMSQGLQRVWIDPDEGESVEIDITGAFPMGSCGAGEGPISANTLATVLEDGCRGGRHAFILTFDDVPASRG